MDVTPIEMTPEQAAEQLALYKEHRHRASRQDLAIMRAYRAIEQGKVVINPLDAVKDAGLDDEGYPKLAFAPAQWGIVHCRVWSDEVYFDKGIVTRWGRYSNSGFSKPYVIEMAGANSSTPDVFADLPLIPLHLRPKAKHLNGYYILWEADWKAPPVDPLLLRRLTGHLYLVVAAWDLTPIERAAMAGQV